LFIGYNWLSVSCGDGDHADNDECRVRGLKWSQISRLTGRDDGAMLRLWISSAQF